MRRVRLLTTISGRLACPRCRARVRLHLRRKGAWILALLLAQAVTLCALWAPSPFGAEVMLALGGCATVLVGLSALYSFEPVLDE